MRVRHSRRRRDRLSLRSRRMSRVARVASRQYITLRDAKLSADQRTSRWVFFKVIESTKNTAKGEEMAMKGNAKQKNGSKKTKSRQPHNGKGTSAIDLLMKDHETVQGLFAQFERAREDARKK